MLTLPTALTAVTEEAFAGTYANRVTIGANIGSIGPRAFADISGILHADFTGSGDLEIDDSAFEGTKVIILCTEGSEAYRFAIRNWIPYNLK